MRDEPEASEIAEAFRRRAIGASWAELADFLTARDVHPTTGGERWSKPEVAALIRNPVYMGDGTHEGIVSRDEFDAAQAGVRPTQNGSLASLDARTMLSNQPSFLAALEQHVRRTHRARRREPDTQLSLIVFDGDDLREVNATHGLRAGDDVLAETGARLARALPGVDALVAHYRGDEFVVLLPEANPEDAVSTTRRLLAELQAPIVAVGRITFSAGVATLGHGESPRVFLARAQQAQRRAKQLGKNRIEVAGMARGDALRWKTTGHVRSLKPGLSSAGWRSFASGWWTRLR